ncbi:MAG: patatin-like phospholipase family protein [Rhodospirillaceae bacterium]|nr:patatin-like phospholipase family protein [Rhodospirillaceae bacterium]
MNAAANLSTSYQPDGICRVLSLDGGGAKGFYTLGVLKEIEGLLGCPLHKRFDLIFGTSTGSIIAALLALGRGVDEIQALYTEHVPRVTGAILPGAKSAALRELAQEVFADSRFEDMKTGIGIVATRWVSETPMIFKNDRVQAHGRTGTFVPGFGCSVGDAVEASCAAYPYLKRKVVHTAQGHDVELIDGGYCANNPALYALADAVGPLAHAPADIRLVSIGVGMYPQKGLRMRDIPSRIIKMTPGVRLLQKTLEINTQSMESLRYALFKHIPTVRINKTYSEPAMATDLFEHDLKKLNVLLQRGSESFGEHEANLRAFLL